jgi:hypothetical protein
MPSWVSVVVGVAFFVLGLVAEHFLAEPMLRKIRDRNADPKAEG